MGDRDQASEVPEGQKSREVPEGFRKNRNELLRKIPKIDRLMEMESVKAQCELYGYQIVLEAARKAQEQLREVLRAAASDRKKAAWKLADKKVLLMFRRGMQTNQNVYMMKKIRNKIFRVPVRLSSIFL